MGFWDGLLLAAALLVAVRSLSGMMQRRGDRLVAEVQKQVDAHRERDKALKRKQRRKERENAA